ncbi:NAD(P)H-dependent FMN reductase [Paenibacillus sophorae]|uniref:NAD(P)H-dependent FMN reductase n=1 Tax=Paenibacillus sophorae TaxID=1333845 RepID=A0A1H8W162_9BACL|nr:NADPH-dependent FMN reductase [Paenibacillus sophorae]QWU15450.1 NAD(P)H-dependent oxidoreductase [Paenibacillus sophorae]SEP21253.1 NAD(P)H-dependent FMN reductase [Paenibacillus sophorae]
MSENKLSITAICGSLREGSFNRKVLKAMEELAPKHWEIHHVDISAIPLYNSDIESHGDPQSVVELKESIRTADGVLIITPEYNMGIPGVLKNALDWASRPARSSVLIQKPFAIAGATPGGGGTAQSQAQVRQTLLAMNAYTMPGPKVLIGSVHEKLNETTGELNDESTLRHLERFLIAFEQWILIFKQSQK